MDLLEEAGIPPPKPPILTADDRAALASMALAQSQFYLVLSFFVGMLAGAAVAYLIGYRDLVITLFKWAISGTGLALIVTMLNITKLSSFKCPRCDGNYFSGRTARNLLEAMRHLRPAAQPAGRCGPDSVNRRPRFDLTSVHENCA